jgi:hypothetical protein
VEPLEPNLPLDAANGPVPTGSSNSGLSSPAVTPSLRISREQIEHFRSAFPDLRVAQLKRIKPLIAIICEAFPSSEQLNALLNIAKPKTTEIAQLARACRALIANNVTHLARTLVLAPDQSRGDRKIYVIEQRRIIDSEPEISLVCRLAKAFFVRDPSCSAATQLSLALLTGCKREAPQEEIASPISQRLFRQIEHRNQAITLEMVINYFIKRARFEQTGAPINSATWQETNKANAPRRVSYNEFATSKQFRDSDIRFFVSPKDRNNVDIQFRSVLSEIQIAATNTNSLLASTQRSEEQEKVIAMLCGPQMSGLIHRDWQTLLSNLYTSTNAAELERLLLSISLRASELGVPFELFIRSALRILSLGEVSIDTEPRPQFTPRFERAIQLAAATIQHSIELPKSSRSQLNGSIDITICSPGCSALVRFQDRYMTAWPLGLAMESGGNSIILNVPVVPADYTTSMLQTLNLADFAESPRDEFEHLPQVLKQAIAVLYKNFPEEKAARRVAGAVYRTGGDFFAFLDFMTWAESNNVIGDINIAFQHALEIEYGITEPELRPAGLYQERRIADELCYDLFCHINDPKQALHYSLPLIERVSEPREVALRLGVLLKQFAGIGNNDKEREPMTTLFRQQYFAKEGRNIVSSAVSDSIPLKGSLFFKNDEGDLLGITALRKWPLAEIDSRAIATLFLDEYRLSTAENLEHLVPQAQATAHRIGDTTANVLSAALCLIQVCRAQSHGLHHRDINKDFEVSLIILEACADWRKNAQFALSSDLASNNPTSRDITELMKNFDSDQEKIVRHFAQFSSPSQYALYFLKEGFKLLPNISANAFFNHCADYGVPFQIDRLLRLATNLEPYLPNPIILENADQIRAEILLQDLGIVPQPKMTIKDSDVPAGMGAADASLYQLMRRTGANRVLDRWDVPAERDFIEDRHTQDVTTVYKVFESAEARCALCKSVHLLDGGLADLARISKSIAEPEIALLLTRYVTHDSWQYRRSWLYTEDRWNTTLRSPPTLKTPWLPEHGLIVAILADPQALPEMVPVAIRLLVSIPVEDKSRPLFGTLVSDILLKRWTEPGQKTEGQIQEDLRAENFQEALKESRANSCLLACASNDTLLLLSGPAFRKAGVPFIVSGVSPVGSHEVLTKMLATIDEWQKTRHVERDFIVQFIGRMVEWSNYWSTPILLSLDNVDSHLSSLLATLDTQLPKYTSGIHSGAGGRKRYNQAVEAAIKRFFFAGAIQETVYQQIASNQKLVASHGLELLNITAKIVASDLPPQGLVFKDSFLTAWPSDFARIIQKSPLPTTILNRQREGETPQAFLQLPSILGKLNVASLRAACFSEDESNDAQTNPLLVISLAVRALSDLRSRCMGALETRDYGACSLWKDTTSLLETAVDYINRFGARTAPLLIALYGVVGAKIDVAHWRQLIGYAPEDLLLPRTLGNIDELSAYLADMRASVVTRYRGWNEVSLLNPLELELLYHAVGVESCEYVDRIPRYNSRYRELFNQDGNAQRYLPGKYSDRELNRFGRNSHLEREISDELQAHVAKIHVIQDALKDKRRPSNQNIKEGELQFSDTPEADSMLLACKERVKGSSTQQRAELRELVEKIDLWNNAARDESEASALANLKLALLEYVEVAKARYTRSAASLEGDQTKLKWQESNLKKLLELEADVNKLETIRDLVPIVKSQPKLFADGKLRAVLAIWLITQHKQQPSSSSNSRALRGTRTNTNAMLQDLDRCLTGLIEATPENEKIIRSAFQSCFAIPRMERLQQEIAGSPGKPKTLLIYFSTGYELRMNGLFAATCALADIQPQTYRSNIGAFPILDPAAPLNEPIFRGICAVLAVEGFDSENNLRRCLLIRGFNPSEFQLEQTTVGSLFEGFIEQITTWAKERPFDLIITPDPNKDVDTLSNSADFLAYYKRRIGSTQAIPSIILRNPESAIYNDYRINAPCYIVKDLNFSSRALSK